MLFLLFTSQWPRAVHVKFLKTIRTKVTFIFTRVHGSITKLEFCTRSLRHYKNDDYQNGLADFLCKAIQLLYAIVIFVDSFHYINVIWLCSNWFAMSNSCYNPFIYGFLNVSSKIRCPCSIQQNMSIPTPTLVFLQLFESHQTYAPKQLTICCVIY